MPAQTAKAAKNAPQTPAQTPAQTVAQDDTNDAPKKGNEALLMAFVGFLLLLVLIVTNTKC